MNTLYYPFVRCIRLVIQNWHIFPAKYFIEIQPILTYITELLPKDEMEKLEMVSAAIIKTANKQSCTAKSVQEASSVRKAFLEEVIDLQNIADSKYHRLNTWFFLAQK